MSIVAWDGKTLAADKRCCLGTMILTTTKVWRLPDGRLMGGAGTADALAAMREWFIEGMKRDAYPECQKGDGWAHVIVVGHDRRALIFEKMPYPIEYEGNRAALGSGREFAMAAMHLGLTAPQAVEVACALDSGCGGGIDVLRLDEPPADTIVDLQDEAALARATSSHLRSR